MTDHTTQYLQRLLDRYNHQIDTLISKFGQPLHVFFLEEFTRLVKQYHQVQQTLYTPLTTAFAVKSNPCRGAIRAAANLGLGADCASEFELQAALEEGIKGQQITCNGNAKSNAYLQLAIKHNAIVVIDNQDELSTLVKLCKQCNTTADVLLRFSGMPLSGLTADDQSTAADWTKFGFHINEAPTLFTAICNTPELNFLGISAHIGTQLSKPEGFTRLFECLFDLVVKANELGLEVTTVNIGGGFPVCFIDDENRQQLYSDLTQQLRDPDTPQHHVTWNKLRYGLTLNDTALNTSVEWNGKAYWSDYPGAAMLEYILQTPMKDGQRPLDILNKIGSPQLIVEPGRSITAPAGITICEVMGTKKVMSHNVVLLNLGINNHSTNLIAPDIFPATVWPINQTDSECTAFLAGRLCFTGDMISKNKVSLNRLPVRGEQLVIYHTGGYSADHFASHSCGYPRPGKVAILNEDNIELWRAPENYQSVFGAAGAQLTIE